MGAAHRPAVCLWVEMGLVFAEVDTESAEVLVQVVGRDKSLGNLVVLRLLVVAAAVVLAAAVALAAELDLPSSHSNNQHY